MLIVHAKPQSRKGFEDVSTFFNAPIGVSASCCAQRVFDRLIERHDLARHPSRAERWRSQFGSQQIESALVFNAIDRGYK